MTVLLTGLRALWSKAGLYAILAISLCTAMLGAFAYVSNASKSAERLQTTTRALKNMERAKRVEAQFDAIDATDARNRLRERWSRR